MSNQNGRNTTIDNFRAILIFGVVAGHLLEILGFRGSRRLYVLLYSFHMPAFVFISGMCCNKPDQNTPKKLLCNYLYPYLVFQTLYITFDRWVLHQDTAYQYTTPYWLLWYLLAMILWQIMLWLYSCVESRRLALSIAVTVALLAGFDSSVGYHMSLSRTLVLFPFFLAGYYSKSVRFFSDWERDERNAVHRKMQIAAMFVGCGLFAGIAAYAPRIHNAMLYHSHAYYPVEYGIQHRAMMMLIAGVWIGILFALVPRKKIPWMTYCGKNTMPVFVLHGFVIRILREELADLQLNSRWLLFIVLTLLIPAVFTLPPVIAVTRPLMRFKKIWK